jgi:FtsP/CotA-like multicopper oxidase with cupredoxin domain
VTAATRITRRRLFLYGAAGGAALFLPFRLGPGWALAQGPGGTLPPEDIPKYETPLVIPPAMPLTGKTVVKGGKNVDYYEIGVRQFEQHILPESMGLDPTTVWSYGSVNHPETFNYPAFTIEATWRKPVRVKWINELVDEDGNFLPHLVPVDQTLHWANPPGGIEHRDDHGHDPTPYTGPVPIVTHLHGGHTSQESDGYAEAWYLPDADDVPAGYASVGSFYEHFREQAEDLYEEAWTPGSAVFQYDNDQRASTLWYHDHTLGMTRANVYAGPAGFYLVRGGPSDAVGGKLPGPAPAHGDKPGTRYYEIPLAIQDRAFKTDGSLFYPDNRAFFEGLDPEQLQIPFIPDEACGGMSDISPIFNPEFFGNTILVNGKTWPYLDVEQRRYRFRILNGCNSRFLLLELEQGLPFWQIGTEGGFLPAPLELDRLLLGPAERTDVIVDFTDLEVGARVILRNLGPDDPFGGGDPPDDFDIADPDTTGQVMQFRVVPRVGPDTSTPPGDLRLPRIEPIPAATTTRQLSLNELDSETVLVSEDGEGNIVLDCEGGEPFGPKAALLGTVADGALGWDDPITENPALGATEVWELHNFTADAHPIHIHEVMFEVVDREVIETGEVRGPETWEAGARKDTVISYPGEITRVRATFDRPGLYVWHCHIVEHEDHEMMRPFRIGDD